MEGVDTPKPEQEPVAWMDREGDVYKELPSPHWCPPHTPLYAHPHTPRKPLSEEEIVRLMVGEDRARLMLAGKKDPEFLRFAEEAIQELVESARAIEKAHGIGGGDGSEI